jgi:anti-sigma regulatory factor (Ser/Thr protein kinase)
MTAAVFAGRPESAGEARRWLARHLAGFPAIEDAQLLVSEMVTNSLLHSRSRLDGGKVRVRLVTSPGAFVRVEVRDDGPVPVTGRAAGAAAGEPAENGHGLVLVAELADSWGTDGRGLAWFRLDWPAVPARQPALEDEGALFALPAAGGAA